MTERVCPMCKADNPPDNRYCGRCGSRLRFHEIVVPQVDANVEPIKKPDLLPELDVRMLGRTVAISVGALVAEVALQRARRRILTDGTPGAQATSPAQSAVRAGVGALVGVALIAVERQLSELDSGTSVRRLLQRNSKDGESS